MVGNSDFMSLVIFLHVPIKKNVEGNCFTCTDKKKMLRVIVRCFRLRFDEVI